tara:strand:- start:954 stop:1400 length:447 start_codon:yes stop_codon:yes gene_type:complete
MILIAHRGNIDGPFPERENTIDYIEEAIQLGYDVEIDLHLCKGHQFYLGHDKPEEGIYVGWLLRFKDYLWCHAKDIPALRMLMDLKMNTFMHDTDDATITSKGYIWTYPGKKLVSGSIAVLPERRSQIYMLKCAGVCSDYVGENSWLK